VVPARIANNSDTDTFDPLTEWVVGFVDRATVTCAGILVRLIHSCVDGIARENQTDK